MEAEPELLTVREVAALFRVTGATVNRWASNGRIPSLRTPSGSRRFRREDVQQLLDHVEGCAS